MKVLGAVSTLLSLAACHGVESSAQLHMEDLAARAAVQSNAFSKQLRVLPLGGMCISSRQIPLLTLTASITFGYHSTDGNGYRKDLEDLLAPIANVTYIGTQCSGSMTNGNNEGHPGFVISQMEAVAAPDLSQKPNVVLVYVGTNDMLYPVEPATAPQRMAALVSYLAGQLPQALIVVGNLFLETDPVVQARIDTFNKDLPAAIQPLQAKGVNAVIADFSTVLTKADLHCDGEHPNDVGYAKMARVFFDSLLQAEFQGKIHGPGAGSHKGTVCHPLPPTPTGVCSSTTTSSYTTSAHPAATTPKPLVPMNNTTMTTTVSTTATTATALSKHPGTMPAAATKRSFSE